MEFAVFRTLEMLQTSRDRNHAIIDYSYNVCLSTFSVASSVEADLGQCV